MRASNTTRPRRPLTRAKRWTNPVRPTTKRTTRWTKPPTSTPQTRRADEYAADEAADEGEAADEALDEAVDEAADESFDEAAISASARLRANRDRNRRASWARRIAADQRLEAKRAASAQRSLTGQIKAIQPGAAAKVSSVGTLQGAGVVTAVLPNGRRSRMRIIPTLAPVREVNRLRSVLLANERRQAMATSRNSRAIRALAVTQASAVRRMTASQLKSDKDLGKRIVEGHNRLDARITKELGGSAGGTGMHGKRMMAMLRRQRQRSIMNSVTIASSLPFWAAFGKKDDPFATNNLILGGSLLGWLVGDELIDQFSGKSGVAKTGANWWSWLAPIGNGATVFFLLKDKQHERFIGGITDVPNVAIAGGAVRFLSNEAIGEDSFDDFKKDKHGATATLISSSAAGSHISSATVNEKGELVVTFDGPPTAAGRHVRRSDRVGKDRVDRRYGSGRGPLCEDGVVSNDLSMLCQEPTRVGRFKRRRDRQSPSRGHG